jgi:hypothetical protein
MGDDVYIDMTAHSPAMHEKKKLEVAMKQAFASEFGEHINLKLKIVSPELPATPQLMKSKENRFRVFKISLLSLPEKVALENLLLQQILR